MVVVTSTWPVSLGTLEKESFRWGPNWKSQHSNVPRIQGPEGVKHEH